jgi:rhodanese-related sulfurtransferase
MARNWLLPVLFVLGVYIFSSQGLKSGPEILPQETAALMKGEPPPVLIDLRERAAYDQGHIPGAISVPEAQFKERLAALKLPKADAVVLYGADDARTRDATKYLYENGYHGALTLKGGIAAWGAAGQAVTKPQGSKP